MYESNMEEEEKVITPSPPNDILSEDKYKELLNSNGLSKDN